MSSKSARIAAMIEELRGRRWDAHYLGYFDCFDQQRFYEAHDVLEELWLGQRREANGLFYKGLIQLAGAFVHLQKNRLRPAAALLGLARSNLANYPERHEALDVRGVLELIANWRAALERSDFSRNPLTAETAPKLRSLLSENVFK